MLKVENSTLKYKLESSRTGNKIKINHIYSMYSFIF